MLKFGERGAYFIVIHKLLETDHARRNDGVRGRNGQTFRASQSRLYLSPLINDQSNASFLNGRFGIQMKEDYVGEAVHRRRVRIDQWLRDEISQKANKLGCLNT